MSGNKPDITASFQTWGGRGPVVNNIPPTKPGEVPAGYANAYIVDK